MWSRLVIRNVLPRIGLHPSFPRGLPIQAKALEISTSSRRTLATILSSQAKLAKGHQDLATPSTTTMSSLRFKGRVLPKKKRLVPAKDAWSVVGYATADSYDLFTLAARLHDQGLYEVVPLEDELTSVCLCVTAKYNFDDGAELAKDIYFFGDGTVVFWNIPELERDNVLLLLRKSASVEDEPYDEESIFEESEMMNVGPVAETPNGANSEAKKVSSHLDSRGVIRLSSVRQPPPSTQQGRDHTLMLEQYAFSNAIASSVKLGMLEASLEKLVNSIEFLSDDLKGGRDVKMSQSAVLKKSGEIFALRHVVNLSSDLLDTPDFYWDRETLESLYHVTCAHLAIGKRTRVMNEKLTHLCELMELVRTHLSDKHHVRLEWFIIALIWVEVIFEFLHFGERFM